MVLMTFLIKLIMLNDIKYNVKRDISEFKGHLSFIYEIERVQKNEMLNLSTTSKQIWIVIYIII